jgi:hypothetical protein
LRLPRRPALLALGLTGALALTACGTGDQVTSSPSDTATSSPSTVGESPSPTTASGSPASDDPASPTTGAGTTSSPTTPSDDVSPTATVPSLSTECELDVPSGDATTVRFAAPAGWQVEGGCEILDPALDTLPDESEPDAALSVRATDTNFAMAAQTESIDGGTRHVGARSGYPAVRIRGDATGRGLRPEGEPVQLWLVDLDAGIDEEGGTLVMSAGPSSGADFDVAAETLDRMAETLLVRPHAAEDAPVVVTRAEGGGTPYAVTFDRDEGCMQLRAGAPSDDVVDEDCDIDGLGARDRVVGTILASGGQQVVAGLAPALANRVESDGDAAPSGAVTTSLEGASAFAYETGTAPIDVRAIGLDGETLATASIE